MTRPSILDLDLVVVPREATVEMWREAATPIKRYGVMKCVFPVNYAACLSYRAALSASPYLSAWDDVRKYVGGLEAQLVAVAGPCSLGVGCEQYGVCYADAHGKPEECGKPSFECEALKDARRIADHDKKLWLDAEAKIEILIAENSRIQSELEEAAGLEKAAEEELSAAEARIAELEKRLADAERVIEPFSLIVTEGIAKRNDAYTSVTTCTDYFRAASAYMEGK